MAHHCKVAAHIIHAADRSKSGLHAMHATTVQANGSKNVSAHHFDGTLMRMSAEGLKQACKSA
jgi:hypothetical protein